MAESEAQLQWVEEQLSSWGLGDFCPIFKDEGIDKETLLSMPPDVVKELIPKVGPRCVFLRKRNELVQKKNDETVAPSLSINSSIVDPATPNPSTESTSSAVPADTPEESSVVTPEANTKGSVETSKETSKKTQSGEQLKKLLAETATGQALLDTPDLDDRDRHKLCGIIIEHELSTGLKIRTEKLQFWATEIHEYWDSESVAAYFIPYQSVGKRSATGRLWNKYTNTKKYLKKHILPTDQQAQPKEISDDDEKNLLQLKTISPDDLESAKVLWEKTYDLREQNKTLSISAYYQEYPILATPIGSSLLQLDFKLLNVCTDAESFLKKWPDVAAAVVETAKKKTLPSLEEEVNIPVEVLGLLRLPYLLRPTLVKTKSSKKWKPSTQEQADGFICNIAVMSDLETLLVKRTEKLSAYGLSRQPLIVTVGVPTAFSAIYVIVDEVKYAASNLIGAVDLCFKVHHALNAKYTPESEVVWVFLEKFLYGIEGPKHFVSVEVLHSDLIKYQKSNQIANLKE